MAVVLVAHLGHQLNVTRCPLPNIILRRVKYSNIAHRYSPCIQHVRTLDPVCSKVLSVQLQFQRNAGHSHWQNIKHIKGAKDAEKMRQMSILMARLRVAVKEGGSCDPKLNTRVANVLEDARAKSIPKTTLTEYLKKLDDKSKYKIHTFEAKGPGQSLFIFEVFTDKPGVVEGMLQGIFKRNQGKVGKNGFASFGFEHRGWILVEGTEELTLDNMTDIAIESEAEEVQEVTEDDQTLYQLLCPGEDLYKVKGNLEKAGVSVKKTSTTWEPKTRITLTESDNELVNKIFSKLQLIEEVEQMYDNLETTS